jgi:hypothetical protein
MWMDDLYDHPPVWVSHGEGSHFTDVDGHTYLHQRRHVHPLRRGGRRGARLLGRRARILCPPDGGAFGRGTIGRANLDGTGVDPSFITLAGKPYGPYGVAVDGSHVYWTDAGGGGSFGQGTIGRANLDGTGVDKRFITGVGYSEGVAVDDTHVYWAGGNTIGRANIDGTGVDRDFITGAGPWEIAVDALRSFGFGQVKKNEKNGTAKLAVKVPGPGELELTNTTEVKGAKKRVEAKGGKLPVRAKGETNKSLKRKGKAKVKAEVTYTPTGVNPTIVGNTDTKKVKLIKR